LCFVIAPVFESNDCYGHVRALEWRDFLVRWGRRLLCAVIVAVVAFGGYRGYAAWRKQHLATQVRQFVERGEYQSAVLVVRRLLGLDENNLAACQAMAEMAEKSGRIEAVVWRKKIAHLAPNIPAHQLALAKAALRFGQFDFAGHVLNSLPEAAREGVEYHQLAGAEALVRQQRASAETHFAAALQISPNDPHLTLNLALLRLASSDPKVALEARAKLADLSEQAAVRADVLRALTADALAHHNRPSAENWATKLQAETGATFSDALLYFQAVAGTEAAAPALAQLLAKAAPSAATTAELITWLNRHGLAQVAAHWSSLLPKEITGAHPVPLAMAESLSFLQDWPALRAAVEGKNWGEFEAMRLAVESHALHRLNPLDGPSMETETVWRAALKTAQAHPDQLIAIAQLAEGWGYQRDAEEAWWMSANGNHNPKVALSALQRFYKASQDTRGLLRVARRALELNPGDLVAANNCASFGLLLNSDRTSRRLALKLHTEHPTNRAFAATYAFALHTEGKLAEGLKVMESLKDQELRHPSIAAYYVVMLVDNGNLERARSYLANAERATLLPEERQLLSAAARKLTGSS
jgi:predicted Zn-dependent protease